MKILFIAQFTLNRHLGGPKVVIEISEAINKIGEHIAEVVGPEEIRYFLEKKQIAISESYAINIKNYLYNVINEFDVVDCDHCYLHEFLRTSTSPIKTLIVARSVLFIPHLKYIEWPKKQSFLSLIVSLAKKSHEKRKFNTLLNNINFTLRNVDLINVSNDEDLKLLTKYQIPPTKVIVLPYGISESDNQLFEVAKFDSKSLTVGFIGTFDYRKGCIDIPKFFGELKEKIPGAKLLLLGCKGLFRTKEEILAFFPKHLHASIQLVLEYNRDELSEYLKMVRVGIFPSYLEGFGFSVIEMMAAGKPVIAYDAPGPSSILPKEFLVKPRDIMSLVKKIEILLIDDHAYEAAKMKLIYLSLKYNWPDIAKDTLRIYDEKLKHKLSKMP